MSSDILVEIDEEKPKSQKEEDNLTVKSLIINSNSNSNSVSNSTAIIHNDASSEVAVEREGKLKLLIQREAIHLFPSFTAETFSTPFYQYQFKIVGTDTNKVGEIPSYQNQTQADIESGRARVNSADSVVSFGSGSGHSDDALLPEVKVKRCNGFSKQASNVIQSYGSGQEGQAPSASTSSPRRSNRENLSLLRGRHRSSSYEEIGEIPEYENSFPGIYDKYIEFCFYVSYYTAKSFHFTIQLCQHFLKSVPLEVIKL